MLNNYIRVHNKKDTHDRWSSLNPILLDGEIIIVSFEEGSIKFKVGDGIAHYNNLPFLDINNNNNTNPDISEEQLEYIKEEINSNFKEIQDSLSKKLESTTSPENAGMIISVDSEGNLVFVNLDTSGENITVSSVIGLSELLESKAENSVVQELSKKLEGLMLEIPEGISIDDIEGLNELLESIDLRTELEALTQKVDDLVLETPTEIIIDDIEGLRELLETIDLREELSELSQKVENLVSVNPTEISINDIVGLAEILREKADDSEVKELSHTVDSLSEEISSVRSELENKLSAKVPVSEAGKVLYIDEQGNIVPKKIEFTGGSGGGSGSGTITWGDLINMV